jgi:hypothetical protein
MYKNFRFCAFSFSNDFKSQADVGIEKPEAAYFKALTKDEFLDELIETPEEKTYLDQSC